MSDVYNFAQVQVRLIDFAERITQGLEDVTFSKKPEDSITDRTKLFDQAYKALIKTIQGD